MNEYVELAREQMKDWHDGSETGRHHNQIIKYGKRNGIHILLLHHEGSPMATEIMKSTDLVKMRNLLSNAAKSIDEMIRFQKCDIAIDDK